VRRKYLVLLLIPLLIAFAGCRKKKYVAPPPPPPELEAPSNLTATAISYKQINLSWQDNSDIEEGFRVCCDMGGNQYQTVDTLPANTTSFEHHKLQPLTKYTYYVQAYWKGKYANSKEVSLMTPDPIEIWDPYIYAWSNWGAKLVAAVRNYAFERCKVELKATFYDKDGIECDSWTEIPILAAGEIRTVCFYTRILGQVDKRYLPTYTIEIIKAEILY